MIGPWRRWPQHCRHRRRPERDLQVTLCTETAARSASSTKALLAMLDRKILKVFTTRNVEALRRGRWTTVRIPARVDPRRLYVAFAESVLAGRPPEIGGKEGRRILSAILAAYESGRTGTRVRPGGMVRLADRVDLPASATSPPVPEILTPAVQVSQPVAFA
jgi:hypothetical protein